MRAMEQGFIGMSATNTSPLMCPTRSMEAGLGTNPISFAAPADKDDSFVLDMATTAVAVGKIEIQRRKGAPIPHGWAHDTKGNMTTNADVGFESACLAPLGGDEITSGFKGYGLGAMVEVLCGILAGANFSTKIRKWTHSGADSEANLGQFFMALDPKCFAPGFTGRMSEMNEILRNLTPVNPENPVLIAGDPERNHMKKVDSEGGVHYTENQIKTCAELSKRLGVSPIRFIN
jgi:LDH2 family malate/lactate/ureidoglycolate dehydrogenase